MLLCGNAVVGQSGGPTAAINATLSGVIRGALEAKEQGIIKTLYGMRNGIEGFLREDLVDLFNGTCPCHFTIKRSSFYDYIRWWGSQSYATPDRRDPTP